LRKLIPAGFRNRKPGVLGILVRCSPSAPVTIIPFMTNGWVSSAGHGSLPWGSTRVANVVSVAPFGFLAVFILSLKLLWNAVPGRSTA
jgi:hypothetical protein